jgi:hypothetical protein
MIVQKLPFPTTNKPNVHVIRGYHKHLHDGTKRDAVSGWLLYASFYYVLGQYNSTNTSNLIDDSCKTASLLNNVLTVKTSRSPFRSLSNIVNNSRLLD